MGVESRSRDITEQEVEDAINEDEELQKWMEENVEGGMDDAKYGKIAEVCKELSSTRHDKDLKEAMLLLQRCEWNVSAAKRELESPVR